MELLLCLLLLRLRVVLVAFVWLGGIVAVWQMLGSMIHLGPFIFTAIVAKLFIAGIIVNYDELLMIVLLMKGIMVIFISSIAAIFAVLVATPDIVAAHHHCDRRTHRVLLRA